MKRFEFPKLAELLASKSMPNNVSEHKVGDMFPNMGDVFPNIIEPAK
ncbi:MAG TPA: hypothetical protein VND91_08695 [Candidatus Saccharimonadia bacterium]|nr:hypothetical protein [Candidatus Saccharimonadia bacterium]